MVESRAAAKLRRLLGIALIFLFAHPMNAETTAMPTGIEGTVTVSPIRGGPIRQGEPNSAPMRDTDFVVEAAAGKVATFKTDAQGKFKVGLPPGRYTIVIQKPMMKGRGCSLTDVEVTAAGFKKVQLACDSGMR
jgi:hypothetical protein